MTTKLFLVSTTSTFVLKYAIEASSEEEARRIIDKQIRGEIDNIDEFDQIHLGEVFKESREITLEEFHALQEAQQGEGSNGSWWMGEDLIYHDNDLGDDDYNHLDDDEDYEE